VVTKQFYCISRKRSQLLPLEVAFSQLELKEKLQKAEEASLVANNLHHHVDIPVTYKSPLEVCCFLASCNMVVFMAPDCTSEPFFSCLQGWAEQVDHWKSQKFSKPPEV
jgi:hypothetical protein